MECPTKLYYTRKKEYVNKDLDDSFLKALADGGFQIGELAKSYFAGGIEVDTLDYGEALNETNELLKRDKVVIFEAAISYKNFFIRVDVLVKDGNNIELIEVKAKSAEEASDSIFLGAKGEISGKWKPYLYDVAFQKHVASKAFPDYNIAAYLMLTNKSSKCPSDGLNHKFRIVKDGNGRRKAVLVGELSEEEISQPILCRIKVDKVINLIYQEDYEHAGKLFSYNDLIYKFAEEYALDRKITPEVSKNCKTCEFKATEDEIKSGFKSGYHECFNESLGWTDKDFSEGTIYDIWDLRITDKLISKNKIKMSDLDLEDISGKPSKNKTPGISRVDRQWLQIEKVQNNDNTYWIDKEGLIDEMIKWKFPLHFIDFETNAVAVPFNKGRRPYEGLAFQFSHHIVDENGNIEHRGQYLNTEIGAFPSYDFIRNLKKELENDNGTIFRYAAHENTYLNLIYSQLKEDESNIPDRDELCSFIKSITKSKKESTEKWEGPRNMVDMLELVKKHYYDPAMKGSNSIKVVLPAMLNSSKYLQEKYSKPIYGRKGGIPSKNYKDWTWIKYDGNKVTDPYKLLPKMFEDMSDKDYVIISEENELCNGGAAMTAYVLMQLEDMSDYERKEIEKALLKYCELDTLAMVMIYEGWKDMMS